MKTYRFNDALKQMLKEKNVFVGQEIWNAMHTIEKDNISDFDKAKDIIRGVRDIRTNFRDSDYSDLKRRSI